MTIADFALAAVEFNFGHNEANTYYKEFQAILANYEKIKAYSAHLKEELAEHLAHRN